MQRTESEGSVCSDALLENKKFVRVDLQDLKNFDSQLGRAVAENPSEYLPVVSPCQQLMVQLMVQPSYTLQPSAS